MYFSSPTNNAVTQKDMYLFLAVCVFIRNYFNARCIMVDQNPKSQTLEQNCHSICRAISLFKKELQVIDGQMIGIGKSDGSKFQLLSTNHSWLLTPDGAIIDPYLIGVVSAEGVLLIPRSTDSFAIHGCNRYLPNDDTDEKEFDVTDAWKRARSMLRTVDTYSTQELTRKFLE